MRPIPLPSARLLCLEFCAIWRIWPVSMTRCVLAVVLWFFFLSIAATPEYARAEVHPDILVNGLEGKDVTSLVVIGAKGTPTGYSAPYPVITLAYPDGQLVYRVEWAIMRGAVGRMDKSFAGGSKFEVKSVELKDDRLEIKLVARDRDSGLLRLMLGPQWKTKMTDAAVLGVLGKFLQLPQSMIQPVVASVPSDQPGTPPVTSRVTPRILYERRSDVSGALGRLQVTEVNGFLQAIDGEITATKASIQRLSISTSRGLQAFQAVYASRRDVGAQRLVLEITAKQSALGLQLAPQSAADVNGLDALFEQCRRMARLRQVTDNSGREVGPGGNNSDYVQAFLAPDSGSRKEDIQQLLTAFERTVLLTSFQNQILAIESSLDAGEFERASTGYSSLDSGATVSPAVATYFQKSSALRADVVALVRAKQVEATDGSSIAGLAEKIDREETLRSEATGKALAQKYLDSAISEEKNRLNSLVDALPSYQYPRSHTPLSVNRLTIAQAQLQSTELSDSLKNVTALIAVIDDPSTMKRVHAWFGDTGYEVLLKKAHGVQEATAENAELQARIEALQTAQRQAEAERQTAAQSRANAAGEIVNTAIIITKLDEEFRQTEVIGLSMEAQKQRARLALLARTYRSPDIWGEVQTRFQTILPGLTVWEANHIETMLESLR